MSRKFREEMAQLRKFKSYYGPYRGLFALDMSSAIVYSGLSILFPVLTRNLLKTYIPEADFKAMGICFALMLAIYLAQMGLNYIRLRYGHYMGVKIETDMRKDLFSHLQRLSVSYFDVTKTGHIMSRMTNDLFQIAEVAHHVPEDFLISVVTVIAAYIVMFGYSVPLSLISVAILPFMLAWGIVQGQRLRAKSKAVRATVADVNATVENSIQGIREVKSFTSEELQAGKFSQSNGLLKESRNEQYKVMATHHSIMQLLSNLYYFNTVVGGGILIYFGKVQPYDLVTFLLFVNVVNQPIDRMIQFVEQLQQGMASFERFTEILAEDPEINDAPGAAELKVTDGEIVYEAVDFSYTSKDGEVLGKIDMHIKGGTKVGIAGESGAGKTTAISLLPRFYETCSGRILIDGQDVRTVTQRSLRQNIGIVQQNVFLFDDTIRENLKYGKADATEQEMWDALEAADLDGFVRTLPMGLDTQVGERGTRLSGGQRQRLSIARVFLKNPKIIIFDEATSSLDSESEAQIQKAFDRLSEGRTSIVIAHRLSTIEDADEIFVMSKGSIVERGTASELLASNGQYAKLRMRQGR